LTRISARARWRKIPREEIERKLETLGEDAIVLVLAASRCRLKDGKNDLWPVHSFEFTMTLPAKLAEAIFDMVEGLALGNKDAWEAAMSLYKRAAEGG